MKRRVYPGTPAYFVLAEWAMRLALLVAFCAVIGALFGSTLIGLAVGLGLALAAQLA